MNVKELIQCLLKYPMDSEVVLMEEKKLKHQDRLCSYVTPLHGAMILYTTIPGDKELRVQINITDYSKIL